MPLRLCNFTWQRIQLIQRQVFADQPLPIHLAISSLLEKILEVGLRLNQRWGKRSNSYDFSHHLLPPAAPVVAELTLVGEAKEAAFKSANGFSPS